MQLFNDTAVWQRFQHRAKQPLARFVKRVKLPRSNTTYSNLIGFEFMRIASSLRRVASMSVCAKRLSVKTFIHAAFIIEATVFRTSSCALVAPAYRIGGLW